MLAHPIANLKLQKRINRVAKKAVKEKSLAYGVAQVLKSIRKGQKGICVMAGDVSPIDIISHLPVVCEEAGIPYVFVPSKDILGAFSHTKRPVTCLLVFPPKDQSLTPKYNDLLTEVQKVSKTAEI
uniref:Ribosomal protein eL8/eL30/eS12/Gadd45 domain-containing protein n=1 Tax=Arcella intermedia TaxID=1963864 RepID=A0A6B2LQX5_9EUKA